MNNTSEHQNKDRECNEILNEKDYYKILGVKKDASDDDIRRAYKKLAVKFHPDKNNSKYAEDAFKKVSHSFSVLSNEEKRRNYDRFGSEEGISSSGSQHFDFDEDPFVILFNSESFRNVFRTKFWHGHQKQKRPYTICISKWECTLYSSLEFPGHWEFLFI